MRSERMKKQAVSYKNFRLSKINSPEFSHLKYLLSWILYIISHILTETLIPAERCYTVHSPIDDIIPFCEIFIIPYVLWYPLIAFTVFYFLKYDIDSFKSFSKFIIITQIIAVSTFVLFPTKQELRPIIMPRDNIFTYAISFLYTIDTNTGVCPSLHVCYSMAVASVWLKYKNACVLWKIFTVLLVIAICLATMLIKQHSIVDLFVALPICLFAEAAVYGKRYKSCIKRK